MLRGTQIHVSHVTGKVGCVINEKDFIAASGTLVPNPLAVHATSAGPCGH